MDLKKKYNKEVFVYFLLKNQEVVYVGQTSDGLNRIKTHYLQKTKDFDDYKTIKCCKRDLNELENYYILKYQPKYNKQLNGINVKSAYIMSKLKDVLGFNPYSVKRIEEIINISPFNKSFFKNNNSLKRENAELLADFLIKKYYEENEEIKKLKG